MEGCVRKLTLKNCQVDQAGEVSYQALNAITSAMLNVKGKKVLLVPGLQLKYVLFLINSLQHKGVRSTDTEIKNFRMGEWTLDLYFIRLTLQYLVHFWWRGAAEKTRIYFGPPSDFPPSELCCVLLLLVHSHTESWSCPKSDLKSRESLCPYVSLYGRIYVLSMVHVLC